MNESRDRADSGPPASSAIILPPSLDDQSVERMHAAIAERGSHAPLVMNARQCVFATPYALATLLAAGERRGVKATFIPPANPDTAAYWARARFFRYADEVYVVRGKVPNVRWASESDVLLEMTRIPSDETSRAVVERVERRVLELLVNGVRMESEAAIANAKVVAVACRAVETGEGHIGWAMAQIVHYRKQAGLRSLLVGVAGAGAKGTAWKFDGLTSP